MKLEIQTKILHSFMVVALLLGMVPIFGAGNVIQAKINGSSSAPAIKSEAAVIVTTLMFPALSVVTMNIAKENCVEGQAWTSALVQDSGKINLHQPAECFSLGLGRVVTQEQLSVERFMADASIAVPKQSQVFQSAHLDTPVPNNTQAIVPATAFDSGLVQVLLVILLGLIYKFAVRSRELFYTTSRNLYFLCVQRC